MGKFQSSTSVELYPSPNELNANKKMINTNFTTRRRSEFEAVVSKSIRSVKETSRNYFRFDFFLRELERRLLFLLFF